MRVVSCLTLVACLSVSAAGQQPAKVDTAQVLAAAREALGGEARLAGVKNFVASGRTRQVRGDNLLPIEFEIVSELPDKFVRKDEIPAQESAGLRKKALAEAKPIEHRLYYSDYRAVDGFQFPFRLRRAVASQTIEETTFDRFRINTKIDPRRFEVRK